MLVSIPSIYKYQFFFLIYKRNGQKQLRKIKILHKCITANTSAIWQHAAHTTDQLLLAAKQEPYKKSCLLMKNIEGLSGKSSEEWTSKQKKDQIKRVAGLGRRKERR